jgi:hypothetical protein
LWGIISGISTLREKWKYYELAEMMREIKENLKDPKVKKLAPFALSVPAAVVIQGVMPSIVRREGDNNA